jgi:hypothetical protein
MGGIFTKSSSKDDEDEDKHGHKQDKCLTDCKKHCGFSPHDNQPLFGGGKKRKSSFRKSFTKTKGKAKATRKRLK